MSKSKKHTTKQSIKRLESVTAQLYVKVIQLDSALGKLQKEMKEVNAKLGLNGEEEE